MRRIRVRWRTSEVTNYEATFEVPDDWDPSDHDSDFDFWDGNCPELIAEEDRQAEVRGHYFDEFYRETEEVTELP